MFDLSKSQCSLKYQDSNKYFLLAHTPPSLEHRSWYWHFLFNWGKCGSFYSWKRHFSRLNLGILQLIWIKRTQKSLFEEVRLSTFRNDLLWASPRRHTYWALWILWRFHTLLRFGNFLKISIPGMCSSDPNKLKCLQAQSWKVEAWSSLNTKFDR